MSDHGGLKMRYVSWLAGKLPSCEAITVMISEARERRLTVGERVRKWLHFTICEWCARYEHQIGLLRKAARRVGEHTGDEGPELTDAARERLRRTIAERR